MRRTTNLADDERGVAGCFRQARGAMDSGFSRRFPCLYTGFLRNPSFYFSKHPWKREHWKRQPGRWSILKQAFERLDLLRQRAVGASQILDLAHRVQDGGVVASAEAPADLGQ